MRPHAMVRCCAKVSFGTDKLVDNIVAFLDGVLMARP